MPYRTLAGLLLVLSIVFTSLAHAVAANVHKDESIGEDEYDEYDEEEAQFEAAPQFDPRGASHPRDAPFLDDQDDGEELDALQFLVSDGSGGSVKIDAAELAELLHFSDLRRGTCPTPSAAELIFDLEGLEEDYGLEGLDSAVEWRRALPPEVLGQQQPPPPPSPPPPAQSSSEHARLVFNGQIFDLDSGLLQGNDIRIEIGGTTVNINGRDIAAEVRQGGRREVVVDLEKMLRDGERRKYLQAANAPLSVADLEKAEIDSHVSNEETAKKTEAEKSHQEQLRKNLAWFEEESERIRLARGDHLSRSPAGVNAETRPDKQAIEQRFNLCLHALTQPHLSSTTRSMLAQRAARYSKLLEDVAWQLDEKLHSDSLNPTQRFLHSFYGSSWWSVSDPTLGALLAPIGMVVEGARLSYGDLFQYFADSRFEDLKSNKNGMIEELSLAPMYYIKGIMHLWQGDSGSRAYLALLRASQLGPHVGATWALQALAAGAEHGLLAVRDLEVAIRMMRRASMSASLIPGSGRRISEETWALLGNRYDLAGEDRRYTSSAGIENFVAMHDEGAYHVDWQSRVQEAQIHLSGIRGRVELARGRCNLLSVLLDLGFDELWEKYGTLCNSSPAPINPVGFVLESPEKFSMALTCLQILAHSHQGKSDDELLAGLDYVSMSIELSRAAFALALLQSSSSEEGASWLAEFLHHVGEPANLSSVDSGLTQLDALSKAGRLLVAASQATTDNRDFLPGEVERRLLDDEGLHCSSLTAAPTAAGGTVSCRLKQALLIMHDAARLALGNASDALLNPSSDPEARGTALFDLANMYADETSGDALFSWCIQTEVCFSRMLPFPEHTHSPLLYAQQLNAAAERFHTKSYLQLRQNAARGNEFRNSLYGEELKAVRADARSLSDPFQLHQLLYFTDAAEAADPSRTTVGEWIIGLLQGDDSRSIASAWLGSSGKPRCDEHGIQLAGEIDGEVKWECVSGEEADGAELMIVPEALASFGERSAVELELVAQLLVTSCAMTEATPEAFTMLLLTRPSADLLQATRADPMLPSLVSSLVLSSGWTIAEETFLGHQWDSSQLVSLYQIKLSDTLFDYRSSEDRIELLHTAALRAGLAALERLDALLGEQDLPLVSVMGAMIRHAVDFRGAQMKVLGDSGTSSALEEAQRLLAEAVDHITMCSGRLAARVLFNGKRPFEATPYSMHHFTDASGECLFYLTYLVDNAGPSVVDDGRAASESLMLIADRVDLIMNRFYDPALRIRQPKLENDEDEDDDEEDDHPAPKRKNENNNNIRRYGTRNVAPFHRGSSSDLKSKIGDGHWFGQRLKQRRGTTNALRILSLWRNARDLVVRT